MIYCGTAYKLAELKIESQTPLNFSTFSEIRYPPVASVVLGFRREDVAHPCEGFGMLIPKIEGFKILGTIFSSSLFPNRAPAGPCLAHELRRRRAAAGTGVAAGGRIGETGLRRFARAAGRERQAGFHASPFWPRAIPQYNVGYGKFKDLLNEIESKARGLFFAGSFRDGVSLGDSIVSGVNIAERVGTFRIARMRTDVTFQRFNRFIVQMSKAILLVNLGSPDSTSVGDVRRYLNEFLMDGRVIDAPWLVRRFIVGMILINRPKESAHAYEKIWTKEGSPLVVTSRHVQKKLQERVNVPVELAMRYQNPSIESAVKNLAAQRV